jgi:osmotically inducible protein OsmC
MDRGAIAVSGGAGTGTDVTGILNTDSGALTNTPYSQKARLEREASPTGTNPEELLAAAEASCFTMELGERLALAGHPARSLRTEARVQLVKPGGRWIIGGIRIHCTAVVPGISDSEFLAIAHEARTAGPIAQALRPDLTLTVSLEGHDPMSEVALDPLLRPVHRW